MYVENECGSSDTAVTAIELVCPSEIYFSTFDGTDDPASNWSKTSGVWWACNWFQGQICDSNAACTVYGTPHFYAWRTAGFTIPDCWSGDIVLTINHSCDKQEFYYDRSRVEFSTVSASGPWLALIFYDHPYTPDGWWEYGWSTRDSHANLHTYFNPGDTIYLRFDSYSLDSIGNSASGWHIYEMTID